MTTNRKTYLLFPTVALLCIPIFASANVSITEISWMGSSDSANHEWIELTNFKEEAISVEGWKLIASDGSPSIDLVGEIPAKASVVLERTSDDSAPDIDAFNIYSGALGNSGENLVLTDSSNAIIDQVISSDGWKGGNNTTKETMQLTKEGDWTTAEATPGSYVLNNTTEEPQESPLESQEQVEIVPPVVRSAPADIEVVGEVIFDTIVLVNSPLILSPRIEANGRKLEYGNIQVNFGDGNYYSNNNTLEGISHKYKYPGKYIVTYELRKNPWQLEPTTQSSIEVTVLESIFTITQKESDLIELEYKGNTTNTIDLSGWSITNADRTNIYTLPPMTKIEADPLRIVIVKFDFEPLVLIDNYGVIRAESDIKNDPAILTGGNIERNLNTLKPPTITILHKKNPPTTEDINKNIKKVDLAASPILSQSTQTRKGYPLWWLGLIALLILGLGLIGYLFQSHYPLEQDHQE